jgi:predicted permease
MTDWHKFVSSHAPSLPQTVADELAQHLADLYDEAIRDGLSERDAQAAARAAFADAAARLPEEVEAARRTLASIIANRWTAPVEPVPTRESRFAMITDLPRDIRYAFRMLARAPGFTAVVILTLALGIGANAVVFSAVDALFLRRADVGDPDRLVRVYTGSTDGETQFSSSSFPDYVDLEASGVFSGLASFGATAVGLTTGSETTQLTGDLVSGNYFDVLDVRPAIGRGFAPDEDQQGRPVRVVVVSDAVWRDRLGASPNVPGLQVTLNGQSYTVIGVMPQGFLGPVLGRVPDLWLPSAMQQEVRPPSAGLMRALGTADLLGQRMPGWINMIARLQPGQTMAEASAGAETVAARLRQAFPDTNEDETFTVAGLNEGPGVRQQAQPRIAMLGATVLAVLLIACTNVASLMVARAVSRRREMAVRVALGGRPQRLARQWLTESLVLAFAGGMAGLVVAWQGIPLLYEIGFPATVELALNGRVLLVALGLAVGTGLLFGMAPVVESLRRNTVGALRDESGSVTSGRGASRLRRGFVIAQVTLSLALLVGAGLLVRSLQTARGVELGYEVDATVLGAISPGTRYDEPSGQALYRDILDRVRELPGVEAAAFARITVLSGSARTVPAAAGVPATPDSGRAARTNVVSDGYFDTLGVRLLRGRRFTQADTPSSEAVAIVTSHMAEEFWPGEDPLGRQLYQGPNAMTVVGVVEDNVYVSALDLDPLPVFYSPLSQNYESGVTLHVRTSGSAPPTAVVPALRRAVGQSDPMLPLSRVRTLSDELTGSLGSIRLMATLVGAFSVLAVILASIGLYGVMANATEQRRTEISLRLALGAEPRSILLMIVRQGLGLVAIGLVLGLASASALARFVENQLFGISTTDPVTYAGVVALISGVALVASVVPALRAMRVDPIAALRGY